MVVEHVEKRFGGPFFRVVGADGRFRPAEHVAGVYQRRHVLGVAKRRDRRVSRVYRMEYGPFPVGVLVDDRKKYLR